MSYDIFNFLLNLIKIKEMITLIGLVIKVLSSSRKKRKIAHLHEELWAFIVWSFAHHVHHLFMLNFHFRFYECNRHSQ